MRTVGDVDSVMVENEDCRGCELWGMKTVWMVENED